MHGGANEVIGKSPLTSLILKRNTIGDDSPSMEMQQIVHVRAAEEKDFHKIIIYYNLLRFLDFWHRACSTLPCHKLPLSLPLLSRVFPGAEGEVSP